MCPFKSSRRYKEESYPYSYTDKTMERLSNEDTFIEQSIVVTVHKQ